jgi:hypothetical protein
MPRIIVTIELVDEENRPLAHESWSPLNYEDLVNPNLALVDLVENTLVNRVERSLLERLRTTVDRELLTFARRERRRWSPTNVEVRPIMVEAVIDDYTGEYITNIRTPSSYSENFLVGKLIADQSIPRSKETKVSRYKRKPVI